MESTGEDAMPVVAAVPAHWRCQIKAVADDGGANLTQQNKLQVPKMEESENLGHLIPLEPRRL